MPVLSFFAQMIFWEKLLKNALLGTERMPFDEAILPEELRRYLSNGTESDQELNFLRALSLASVYYKSGQRGFNIRNEDFEVCPLETKSYCPAFAVQTWQKVKVLQPKQYRLLELFLMKIIRRQWLILPDEILDLLVIGNSKKGVLLIDVIADVVGERGKWLLRFHSEWKAMLETDNEKLFLKGNLAEKVAALKRIRRSDPERGRTLLISIWEKTPARERTGLLKALAVNFTEADMPFVSHQKQSFAKNEALTTINTLQPRAQIEQDFAASKQVFYRLKQDDLPIHFDWSPGFSNFMLRQLFVADVRYDSDTIKKFLPLAAYLHPSTDLGKIPNKYDNPVSVRTWETYCGEINPILECRRAIENL